MNLILLVIGCVLILEGILPTIAPKKYQAFLKEILKAKSEHLRYFGLFILILGAILIFFSH